MAKPVRSEIRSREKLDRTRKRVEAFQEIREFDGERGVAGGRQVTAATLPAQPRSGAIAATLPAMVASGQASPQERLHNAPDTSVHTGDQPVVVAHMPVEPLGVF